MSRHGPSSRRARTEGTTWTRGHPTGRGGACVFDPTLGVLYFGAPGCDFVTAQTSSATTWVANTLAYSPFTVEGYPIDIWDAQVQVSTAQAASSCNAAIYALGDNGQPDELIHDFGIVSSATTGSKSFGSAARGKRLEPGHYMSAVWADAAIALRALKQPHGVSFGAMQTSDVANTSPSRMTVSVTWASSFPTVAPAWTGNSLSAGAIWFHRLRLWWRVLADGGR